MGKRAQPVGAGRVWGRPPGGPRIIMLGDAVLTVGFDGSDEPGAYVLSAKVVDRISGRVLELTAPFTLIGAP